ncbi:MAG: MOSC domain-containing protein [Deltaproteobacteria bacterium]|nr:MOSC domain-containing protein [Deltaproteobacteria bacterium]MBI3389319.1 MOSC domain-containing protein [Deltaproteobacteria bacterium]
MAIVGRVSEVWRYPVKSMGGERLQRGTLGPRGIPGDRGWAVRDEQAGEIRGAKKLPALLQCNARYLAEPAVNAIPAAEITLPDGTHVRSDDATVSARLSELLGKPVTLWPLQPDTATDHYRRAAPDNPDMMAELREIFGRTADEPLPDLSIFPSEIMEYTSPLGTYFDAFPLHVLTTASLAMLSARTPGARFEPRRFRPNFVIEPVGGASKGLIESAWSGRTLRIGGARIKIEMPCVRCVMTTLPQGDLPKDPSVLRTIVRDAEQNVGVYATVVAAGSVSAGDEVALE